MKAKGSSLIYSRLAVLYILLFAISKGVNAATIRGQLYRVYPNNVIYPAGGIAVTIISQRTGRSSPAYSGLDGMYYIYNVPPGVYNIEVWVSADPRYPPMVYQIVINEPYTDIPRIRVP